MGRKTCFYTHCDPRSNLFLKVNFNTTFHSQEHVDIVWHSEVRGRRTDTWCEELFTTFNLSIAVPFIWYTRAGHGKFLLRRFTPKSHCKNSEFVLVNSSVIRRRLNDQIV